jgi:hypothetical protein
MIQPFEQPHRFAASNGFPARRGRDRDEHHWQT